MRYHLAAKVILPTKGMDWYSIKSNIQLRVLTRQEHKFLSRPEDSHTACKINQVFNVRGIAAYQIDGWGEHAQNEHYNCWHPGMPTDTPYADAIEC